ncbi:hypothetical protein [Pontibacillus yanchengensis]|uniref:hypothetical protein n=1 Tax=Pontibacillus yanchengensis TaxID=462910 RepID=UPI000B1FA7FB|nr:hypothetical protein [Pontibacillus yanchengensis]
MMDKKNKLGLQFDPEGEKIVAEQLSDSYQSGVIDQFEQQERSKKGKKEQKRS